MPFMHTVSVVDTRSGEYLWVCSLLLVCLLCISVQYAEIPATRNTGYIDGKRKAAAAGWRALLFVCVSVCVCVRRRRR